MNQYAKLTKLINKAKCGGNLTLGFLGGSITQGCNPSVPENAYVERVTRWFKETFPNVSFTRVNAGIGATTSLIGVHRMDSDILQYDPDIVFVDFAANDVDGRINTHISYESLIRKLLMNLKEDVPVVEIFMTLNTGESAYKEQEVIANHYGLPVVNFRKEIFEKIAAGEYIWTDIETDEVHPNDRGHNIIKELIVDLMKTAENNTDLETSNELPAPIYSDKYVNGYMVLFDDNKKLIENMHGFKVEEQTFRTINTGITNELVDGAKVTLKINARTLHLLYVKGIEDNRATLSITVDDNQKLELDTSFQGGWGNYPETFPVFDEVAAGEHIVTIEVKDSNVNIATILGALVS